MILASILITIWLMIVVPLFIAYVMAVYEVFRQLFWEIKTGRELEKGIKG